MWAPVWPAARTISSAPSMTAPGTISMRSRAWVKVGRPASAASSATRRYSAGLAAGAYPSRTPMPSAPSARSADNRASKAVTCAGSAGRCQAGSEMRAMKRVQAGVRRQASHRLHPGQRPGGGETVVDRPSLCGGAAVGVGDRGDARLELQRGGDAVHGLQPQAAEVADVTVQVDESGRHDLPRHVDIDQRPAAVRSRSPRSGPPRDGDVPHRVQPRFGIDHPAAAQHQVPVAHRRLLGTSVPAVVGC